MKCFNWNHPIFAWSINAAKGTNIRIKKNPAVSINIHVINAFSEIRCIKKQATNEPFTDAITRAKNIASPDDNSR